MLAFSIPSAVSEQLASITIAFLSIGTIVGSFVAGRVSYRKAVVENAKAEAKTWENLYKATKEQNDKYEQEISDLRKAGHEKDKQIANLNGKIDVILGFMKEAMGKDMQAILSKVDVHVESAG